MNVSVPDSKGLSLSYVLRTSSNFFISSLNILTYDLPLSAFDCLLFFFVELHSMLNQNKRLFVLFKYLIIE